MGSHGRDPKDQLAPGGLSKVQHSIEVIWCQDDTVAHRVVEHAGVAATALVHGAAPAVVAGRKYDAVLRASPNPDHEITP